MILLYLAITACCVYANDQDESLLLSNYNHLPDYTITPIIGILGDFISSYNVSRSNAKGKIGNATSYIGSSYIKFLEMSGARVVPLKLSSSLEEIDKLLSMVHGVLFTGGDSPFWVENSSVPIYSEYSERACYIYNKVKEINNKGDFLPLWAICQGHEVIHICENKEFDTIGNFDGMPPYNRAQNFKKEIFQSPLFATNRESVSLEVISILGSTEVSVLAHNLGISIETYEKYPKFKQNFVVLSTMFDKSGKEFIGLVQSKNYPIFSMQFHPEKNMFEFFRAEYSHGSDGIFAMTYLSNFFVSLGRKSSHIFPGDYLKESLISIYPVVYTRYIFESMTLLS
ncbi:hypothetical protein SteCoe_30486 [Stentor coeruleus]|uniref:folate gamma-glutamyl hydrolase n=1 Tax=Stentor coeruleus TaxID=5963 RepID=A0A1R2B3H2_9CILI|nr:hypothetical protein SteCoe_30486 [Stentor coeruleus]